MPTGKNASNDKKIRLRLFIGGHTASSLAACAAVETCLGLPELAEGTNLTIVDVGARPESARRNGILATPTLFIEYPGGRFKLVGDLGRGEQLHDLLRIATTSNR